MVDVERERFEAMVGEALDGLAPDIGPMMRSVAVTSNTTTVDRACSAALALSS